MQLAGRWRIGDVAAEEHGSLDPEIESERRRTRIGQAGEALAEDALRVRKGGGKSHAARVCVPLVQPVVVAGEAPERPSVPVAHVPARKFPVACDVTAAVIAHGRDRGRGGHRPEFLAAGRFVAVATAVVEGHDAFPATLAFDGKRHVQVDLDAFCEHAPARRSEIEHVFVIRSQWAVEHEPVADLQGVPDRQGPVRAGEHRHDEAKSGHLRIEQVEASGAGAVWQPADRAQRFGRVALDPVAVPLQVQVRAAAVRVPAGRRAKCLEHVRRCEGRAGVDLATCAHQACTEINGASSSVDIRPIFVAPRQSHGRSLVDPESTPRGRAQCFDRGLRRRAFPA